MLLSWVSKIFTSVCISTTYHTHTGPGTRIQNTPQDSFAGILSVIYHPVLNHPVHHTTISINSSFYPLTIFNKWANPESLLWEQLDLNSELISFRCFHFCEDYKQASHSFKQSRCLKSPIIFVKFSNNNCWEHKASGDTCEEMSRKKLQPQFRAQSYPILQSMFSHANGVCTASCGGDGVREWWKIG